MAEDGEAAEPVLQFCGCSYQGRRSVSCSPRTSLLLHYSFLSRPRERFYPATAYPTYKICIRFTIMSSQRSPFPGNVFAAFPNKRTIWKNPSETSGFRFNQTFTVVCSSQIAFAFGSVCKRYNYIHAVNYLESVLIPFSQTNVSLPQQTQTNIRKQNHTTYQNPTLTDRITLHWLSLDDLLIFAYWRYCCHGRVLLWSRVSF